MSKKKIENSAESLDDKAASVDGPRVSPPSLPKIDRNRAVVSLKEKDFGSFVSKNERPLVDSDEGYYVVSDNTFYAFRRYRWSPSKNILTRLLGILQQDGVYRRISGSFSNGAREVERNNVTNIPLIKRYGDVKKNSPAVVLHFYNEHDLQSYEEEFAAFQKEGASSSLWKKK